MVNLFSSQRIYVMLVSIILFMLIWNEFVSSNVVYVLLDIITNLLMILCIFGCVLSIPIVMIFVALYFPMKF